jgi:hypothetical protein
MTRFHCPVLASLFECVEQVFPVFDFEAAVSMPYFLFALILESDFAFGISL